MNDNYKMLYDIMTGPNMGLHPDEKIRALLKSKELETVSTGSFKLTKQYLFYEARLLSLVNYPLFQARELVKLICRCAFNDESLTDAQSIVIMETCLDSRLDNILMEVNFNEGW